MITTADLPNYFLADLPRETELTEQMVREACDSLRRNRTQFLATRPTKSMIRVIANLAESWLDDAFPFRRALLVEGPARTGFSTQTLKAGLDPFFAQLTEKNLSDFLAQELGDAERLEGLMATPAELRRDRASFARGPELLVHVTGGQLPNPPLTSMVFGLLIRSAQFVKAASQTSFIPRLFAHSLYRLEPKLGACLEIAEWKGGNAALEKELFSQADCVTATGSNETLTAIRAQTPGRVRFVGYGHRVSFAYIASEMLSGFSSHKVTFSAARDITAWDQNGCLSPHVVYVENAGKIGPMQFAESLARELETLEEQQPRGALSPEEEAAIVSRRSFYEVRAAYSGTTKIWSSENSTAWTVVYEEDPRFQVSCGNRFVYVKPVAALRQVLEGADEFRRSISTVGLAAPEDRAEKIANELARWGVTRICPLGQMQNPPLFWRHDGRPALGDLVTWADWEVS
ncbi:MAG TPA: acyl-CoA reductase [Methylomirabilota bacterium]|nr:acyl-CoA reductase [Methylomirabilota bacterium]